MRRYFLYGLLLQVMIVGASLFLQNRELIQNASLGVFILICVLGGSGYGWGFHGVGGKDKNDDDYTHLNKANFRVIAFMVPSVLTIAIYAWRFGLSIF
ncbi:MAG: hypothetical protein NUK65_13140 [Firmicutes bacterium]|nr:hypothetical protein [Bacillota bacterium]